MLSASLGYFLNGVGGPNSGVFSGAAAPTAITMALPPGLKVGSTLIFQLFVIQMFPDGSIAPAVMRLMASDL